MTKVTLSLKHLLTTHTQIFPNGCVAIFIAVWIFHYTTLTDHLWGTDASMLFPNSQNSCVKPLLAVTSRLTTRRQACWHLWKWIELRIRGFVTNPICHLPKWSQILVCAVGLYASSSERMMSYTVELELFTGAGFTSHLGSIVEGIVWRNLNSHCRVLLEYISVD